MSLNFHDSGCVCACVYVFVIDPVVMLFQCFSRLESGQLGVTCRRSVLQNKYTMDVDFMTAQAYTHADTHADIRALRYTYTVIPGIHADMIHGYIRTHADRHTRRYTRTGIHVLIS